VLVVQVQVQVLNMVGWPEGIAPSGSHRIRT